MGYFIPESHTVARNICLALVTRELARGLPNLEEARWRVPHKIGDHSPVLMPAFGIGAGTLDVTSDVTAHKIVLLGRC